MTPITLVRESERQVAEGEHELAVLNRSGENIVKWNPMNATETEAAREIFDRAMSEGSVAYSVPASGSGDGEVVRSFDPDASHLIVTNPLKGG